LAMFSLRHLAYATAFLFLSVGSGSAKPDFNVNEINVEQQLASLPLPPAIEPITPSDILEVVSPSRALRDRTAHLPAIVQEAAAHGVPPALVDAVVRIESRYDPAAVGSVGEVGLMQVRPKTAAFLGFQGASADLAEPQTNLRYGVSYLAKAWRLAGGNLCRALMKYRAGHAAERMSALSVEYCRRARLHLAAVGASLSAGDETVVHPPSHARKGDVQLARGGKRTAAAALQKRQLFNRSIRLKARPGVEPADRTLAIAARARLSGQQKHRTIRLVRQAPVWTSNQRLRAPRQRVAYR
jgi:hypothetical protein